MQVVSDLDALVYLFPLPAPNSIFLFLLVQVSPPPGGLPDYPTPTISTVEFLGSPQAQDRELIIVILYCSTVVDLLAYLSPLNHEFLSNATVASVFSTLTAADQMNKETSRYAPMPRAPPTVAGAWSKPAASHQSQLPLEY
jgi:hypothetical protein